jgi:hypothetical protein
LESGEQERIVVPGQPKQKVSKPHLNKPDLVGHTCFPCYVGGMGRRIAILGWSRAKPQDPIWKITKAQKDCERDSNDQTFEQQVQGLEFKIPALPKKCLDSPSMTWMLVVYSVSMI